MISLAEALALYPLHVRPLRTQAAPLQAALGHVLRAPTQARCDLPRFSQSALDGYVLTNEDAAAPCTLTITDSIAAGDTGELRPLQNGECQRILTGARVPPNAGVVVAQERVSVVGDQMTLKEAMKPGANIRWQGEELREHSTIGKTGQRITPGHLASLSAAGIDQVTVTRMPRIRVLVSGDEVKPAGTPLLDGQIWDANGPLALTWLRSQGYEAELRYIGDTREAVSEALSAALDEADLVISTGGVSVGDKDYIIPVAESLGVERVFWQVAQKPGKPLYFGQRGDRTLLGLPGNPGAVLIGLTLHVRAVLDILEGAAKPGAAFFSGVLAQEVKGDAKRDCLHRMRLDISDDGRAQLQPLPHQDSHMLSNLANADVLAHLPAQSQPHAAGSIVKWTRL
ncbi:molybdopterin molybdotransferase MoeA [Stenotrophobium rhamnosiphilum]|uniref:Molybdopterin molybdenumtransferase n=1 Tax=Stenotrophobium rhamnosiphilum TaxID=2029166 RepID=A0A2T5MKT2_9GAMM|nr:molybdopterin molybdotransferase MoeA [Stenotrophobium rhamnosiphilum]PTU33174.1 molybdopterin molybdenumtransferase MoeA [Stenotrophobium rhamnosiphilum]